MILVLRIQQRMSKTTSTMNVELENFKVWLHGYKVSLNVAKTTSMLIGTRHTINDKVNTEPLKANFVI